MMEKLVVTEAVAGFSTASDMLSVSDTCTISAPVYRGMNTIVATIDPLKVLEERLMKLEANHKFDYTMLQCRNCGASLEQAIDDHIVKCPYCSTAYIVGNWQINDRG